MADSYLIVNRTSGRVENVIVGRVSSDEERLVVKRSGKAADAWLGFTRLADGSFEAPPPPPEPTPPEEVPPAEPETAVA